MAWDWRKSKKIVVSGYVIYLIKLTWAPLVTDAPRSFASAPTKPVTRLIEPHRPARPVRRDVDARLRVAARRSGPASSAHDLSRGGRPRPPRCAIPDSQRGVSPRCASSETTDSLLANELSIIFCVFK